MGEGVAEKQSPVQTTKTYDDDVDTDDAERKLALVFAWVRFLAADSSHQKRYLEMGNGKAISILI